MDTRALCPAPIELRLDRVVLSLTSVWRDPHTEVRLKKRIVLALIAELLVDVDDGAAGRCNTWTASRVVGLRSYHRIPVYTESST
jgi:hypothetical protein